MSDQSDQRPAKCPVCGKPLPSGKEAEKFAPLCSRRCADRDLGQWLKGGYVVPGVAEEAETPDQSPGQAPDEE